MSASRNRSTTDLPCRSLTRLDLLDVLSASAGIAPRRRRPRPSTGTSRSLQA
jgi:hypothetical protein